MVAIKFAAVLRAILCVSKSGSGGLFSHVSRRDTRFRIRFHFDLDLLQALASQNGHRYISGVAKLKKQSKTSG
jgi:hypothetical protein